MKQNTKISLIKYMCGFLLAMGVIIATNLHAHAGEMKLHAIYVGQGDALVVESNGHYMMVDSGWYNTYNEVIAYLDKLKIPNKHFDYMVSTHPDADHVGGFKHIWRAGYTVDKLVYSECAKPTIKTYRDFIAAIPKTGAKAWNPVDGESWKLGDATVKVVYDGRQGTTYNEDSIVLKVSCDGKSMLLTADMPSTIEKVLIKKKYDLKANILKVGHHGATLSTCDDFLDVVKPSHAVISTGKPPEYLTPKPAMLKRLAVRDIKTYRTTDGNVLVSVKNGVISCKNKENNGYKNLTHATITTSKKQYYASSVVGTKLMPKFKVKLNGKKISSKYYTVTYTNTYSTGIGQIAIKGLDPYVGKVYADVKILPRKGVIYAAYAPAGKNKIKLLWSRQSHSSGYKIMYSKHKNFKKAKIITIKSSKKNYCTIKKLKYGKKYYVREKAVTNGIGEGKWSKTIKVSIPKR